ncbi:MAG: hypothetical protein RJAPGHWK_000758 [Candidatus Fervidibacter sp.]
MCSNIPTIIATRKVSSIFHTFIASHFEPVISRPLGAPISFIALNRPIYSPTL